MSKDKQQQMPKKTKSGLDRFEPGGDLGPIEDRNQYERQASSLAPEQRELAESSARFADLSQYCSQRGLDIPRNIVERVSRVHELEIPARIKEMNAINKALMEYLCDLGQSFGIRQ
jgi:hypothetical protein